MLCKRLKDRLTVKIEIEAVEILLVAYATETRISFGLIGYVAYMQTFTLSTLPIRSTVTW